MEFHHGVLRKEQKMSNTRKHYDAIRHAQDELELKRNAMLCATIDGGAMECVDVEGKDNAASCLDQYLFIEDEMDDLIAALQAELDNIDDQGGPDECDRAMAQEMKADIEREDA